MKEPDVTAVAILVLVLGIGAGLNLHAGPEIAFSVTCDEPMMDARAFSLELPPADFELGPLEFSDVDFLPDLEIEFGDPEAGIGPI
jgi:hypothetical protein